MLGVRLISCAAVLVDFVVRSETEELCGFISASGVEYCVRFPVESFQFYAIVEKVEVYVITEASRSISAGGSSSDYAKMKKPKKEARCLNVTTMSSEFLFLERIFYQLACLAKARYHAVSCYQKRRTLAYLGYSRDLFNYSRFR